MLGLKLNHVSKRGHWMSLQSFMNCQSYSTIVKYMMTSSYTNISTLLAPFVRGIHRSLVNSLHKDQWSWALVFSLICAWINAWVNSREAGDLRNHNGHYDVIVMELWQQHYWCIKTQDSNDIGSFAIATVRKCLQFSLWAISWLKT